MQVQLSKNAEQVARECAKIVGFKPKKHGETDPSFLVYVQHFKEVLGSDEPKLTDLRIFNAEICGTNGVFRWRHGVPALMRKYLPKAEACRHLYRVWWRRMEIEAEQYCFRSEAEREKFALEQYMFFLCLRPFASANDRTSWILFYMLRHFLGLPLNIITYAEAEQLDEEATHYRDEIFLPLFRKRKMLLR